MRHSNNVGKYHTSMKIFDASSHVRFGPACRRTTFVLQILLLLMTLSNIWVGGRTRIAIFLTRTLIRIHLRRRRLRLLVIGSRSWFRIRFIVHRNRTWRRRNLYFKKNRKQKQQKYFFFNYSLISKPQTNKKSKRERKITEEELLGAELLGAEPINFRNLKSKEALEASETSATIRNNNKNVASNGFLPITD